MRRSRSHSAMAVDCGVRSALPSFSRLSSTPVVLGARHGRSDRQKVAVVVEPLIDLHADRPFESGLPLEDIDRVERRRVYSGDVVED